jgi:hypothetical protein
VLHLDAAACAHHDGDQACTVQSPALTGCRTATALAWSKHHHERAEWWLQDVLVA